MENTKHTPGPWMESSFEVWSPLNGKRFGKVVANLRRAEAPDDEARANARLIAAAPDLLEVAAMVLETIDGGGPVVTFQEAHIAQLRAAIAKATQPWHTITPS
jgi:4-aminobutyrate aminotransferase-like enzyme